MSTHNLLSKKVLEDISSQFKQLRLVHNLSLEELQAATQLKLKTLKRMENGKCLPFRYYRRLLDFYDKKIRILIE
jgi:transcriptional regulator with XRE-family HTH domain